MAIPILPFLCAAGLAAGQQLMLELVGAPRVHEGELIRVRLQFHERGAGPLQFPAPFLWRFGGYRVDPPPDCRRYTLACFPKDMWTFDKFDPFRDIGRARPLVVADINPEIPALKSGSYFIRAVMTKHVIKHQDHTGTSWGYADPREEILSNPVAVEVIPATRAWVRRTIEEARKTLLYSEPSRMQEHKRAARQLGFLYRQDAFEAALDLHGHDTGHSIRCLHPDEFHCGGHFRFCESPHDRCRIFRMGAHSYDGDRRCYRCEFHPLLLARISEGARERPPSRESTRAAVNHSKR